MRILLEGKDIKKTYIQEDFMGTRKKVTKALNGVDFSIRESEVMGVVGESGSGKSTLARIICGLEEPSEGSLIWDIPGSNKARQHRAQMIFQNPFDSLNPKHSIGYMLKEALAYGRKSRLSAIAYSEVNSLLSDVGMAGTALAKYPHQFSGGQRQRLGIARALAAEPSLLICDEPVSALDILVQAQIMELISKINIDKKITILFISHDIEVVAAVSHSVIVMEKGRIMESGDKKEVILRPRSDYTRKLLEAVPKSPWK